MRRISLNARRGFDAANTAEVDLALFQFEHPALEAPIRLSTDPTERLSVEPLLYGTRSTWLAPSPSAEPFLFALVSAELPGDQEDAPASGALVLENVDNRIAEVLRSFTDRATVHMAVVRSTDPDLVEYQYLGLKLMQAGGDAGEVTLTLSRAPIEDELAPMDRFTKDRFPGLFR